MIIINAFDHSFFQIKLFLFFFCFSFAVGLFLLEWTVTIQHLCNGLALYLSPNRSGNNHIKEIGSGAAGRTYSGGKSFSPTLTQHREKVKALQRLSFPTHEQRIKKTKLSSALYQQRRQWRLETAPMRKGKTGRALAFLSSLAQSHRLPASQAHARKGEKKTL